MKKRYLVLILLLIIVSVSATYAFIVRESDTESIITFGSLKMKLMETTLVDGEEVEVDDEESLDISHATNVSRIVRVKNIGRHSMYVRVKLNIYGENDGEIYDISDAYKIDTSDNWIYQDGYYYYKYALSEDEITDELMKEIVFDNDIVTTKYQGSKFNLEIKGEALQRENNKDNVLEAKGWPE